VRTLFEKGHDDQLAHMPQELIATRAALRASRLALVAVAALFGLTGLQESLTTHVPFGPAMLVEDHGLLVDTWRNLREQMVADDEAISACLRDGVPDCAAADTLLHIINDAKAHKGKALIGYVNRTINLLIRPAPGAWVGALEVLTFADGDCKDYSIAKLFALREAGVAPERLRLVIVYNRRRSEDHMVVAAYVEDAWFILDNATMVLATDSDDATLYLPLFLFDDAGVRRYQ
jgi:predicted transglutaminase-like cysteine proteinase